MFVQLKRHGDRRDDGYDVLRIALISEIAPNETRLTYEMDGGTRDLSIAEPAAVVIAKVNAVRAQLARAGRPSTPHTPRRQRAADRSPS